MLLILLTLTLITKVASGLSSIHLLLTHTLECVLIAILSGLLSVKQEPWLTSDMCFALSFIFLD